MKIGIMQPYFFPYVGYFSLIKHTDQWVVFDTPQFIRHGWIERNRILKQTGDWQYIKVPLQKHSRDTRINEILIRDENWKDRILAQLTYYKRKAPHYNQVVEFVNYSLDHSNHSSISSLNTDLLKHTCDYLKLKFDYKLFSDFEDKIDKVNSADEWALNISLYLGMNEYLNPIGGKEFFDTEKYNKADLDIKFLKNNILPYEQIGDNFEPGLSILDLMMFNDIEEIHEHIDSFELIE